MQKLSMQKAKQLNLNLPLGENLNKNLHNGGELVQTNDAVRMLPFEKLLNFLVCPGKMLSSYFVKLAFPYPGLISCTYKPNMCTRTFHMSGG